MRLYFHGPEGADLRQLGFGWAEGRWHYPVEQMMLTLFPGQKPEYPAAPPDLTGEGPAADLTLERAGDRVVFTARILWEGRRAEGRTDLPAAGLEAPPDRAYRPLSRGLKLSFYQAGTALLGREPAWGALTGVRPVKLPTRVLTAGGTLEAARAELEEEYRVSPARAGLALDCARATLAVRERLGPEEVSLYVGVPFCPTRCAYCSFVSADVGRTLGLLEPYTQALCREVAAAGAGLRRAGRKVRSVYFGGGTPTTLSADQLHRVMSALEDHVDLSGCTEYTVEAGRPDTITAEKLSVLRAHGCDRVSVNPQSMSPDVLRAIGRAHTPEDILRAWDLVAQAGFPVRNMDLIAGLPADSEAGFRDSLDRVLALGAENVTVHTLALKKGSRLMLEGSGLPDGEAVAAMLDYAWQTLRTAGYVPYYLYRQKYMSGGFENVGWCRPGTESIYNICMMEELHSILSLGSGGVTKLISPGGGITRLSNPKYPKEYIEHIDGIAAQKERLDWPAG